MLHSAVSVLVVAQSSSEIPEGLMNNPVLKELHVSAFYVTSRRRFIFYVYNHVYFPHLPQTSHILSFWIAFGHESTLVRPLQSAVSSFLLSTPLQVRGEHTPGARSRWQLNFAQSHHGMGLSPLRRPEYWGVWAARLIGKIVHPCLRVRDHVSRTCNI